MPSLSVQITKECNLSCAFCCQKDKPHSKLNKAAVLRSIRDYREPISGFTVSGGEPLLDIPFLKQVVSSVQDRTPQISINTNGHLLTPELITWINTQGIHITLSLQGLSGEKSVKSPEWVELVKQLASFSLSHVATKKFSYQNVKDLHELFQTRIGLSLDITSPFDDLAQDHFESQLMKLLVIDPISSRWVSFTHTTKACEYDDTGIYPDGVIEKVCERLEGFSILDEISNGTNGLRI